MASVRRKDTNIHMLGEDKELPPLNQKNRSM
jgi:hypothetical protein